MSVQRGSKDVDFFDDEQKTGRLGMKSLHAEMCPPPPAQEVNAAGVTDLSPDDDNICWLLITVGNFTRTERSVFAHICMCVNSVFFAEGGTGELSDSADVFVLVGAGSRSSTTEEQWLQSQNHT